MNRNKLLLIPLLLALGACASKPTEVRIITEPVEIKVRQVPLPEALSLETPYYYVVTNKNIDKFLEKVARVQGDEPVLRYHAPRL